MARTNGTQTHGAKHCGACKKVREHLQKQVQGDEEIKDSLKTLQALTQTYAVMGAELEQLRKQKAHLTAALKQAVEAL